MGHPILRGFSFIGLQEIRLVLLKLQQMGLLKGIKNLSDVFDRVLVLDMDNNISS